MRSSRKWPKRPYRKRKVDDDYDYLLQRLLEVISVRAVCVMILRVHCRFLFCERNPQHLIVAHDDGVYPVDSIKTTRCQWEEEETGRGGCGAMMMFGVVFSTKHIFAQRF